VKTETQIGFTFLFVDFQQIEMDRPGLYDIKDASDGIIVDAKQTLTSESENCSASLTQVVPLAEIPHQQDFALLVNHHRQYNLTMFVPPGDFNLILNGQCTDSDGQTTPYMVPLAATMPFGSSVGAIVPGHLPGVIVPIGEIIIDQTTTSTLGLTKFTYFRRANLHSAGP